VAFSPDGKTLASAGWDNTVKLWDAATCRKLHTLEGHTDNVYSVAFSPDGMWLASGSEDHTVRVWDWRKATAVACLKGHWAGITKVAFSKDSKTLATAAGGYLPGTADPCGEIKLWAVGSWKERTTFKGRITGSMSLSPDGKTLVWGEHHILIVNDLRSGKKLSIDAAIPLYCLCQTVFSRDSLTLAVGSNVGELRLYEVATGKLRTNFQGQSFPIGPLAFTLTGETLVLGGGDIEDPGELRLVNVASGKQRIIPTGDKEKISALAFSPDGRTLASASRDGAIKLWNVCTLLQR
jgi:WD40 repeat protein